MEDYLPLFEDLDVPLAHDLTDLADYNRRLAALTKRNQQKLAFEAASEALRLSCASEFAAYNHCKVAEVLSVIELQSLAARAPDEGQTIDLVLVIDTSDSMEGEKLAQAKRALLFLLDRLQSTDRVAVVNFASDVSAISDLCFFSAATRELIKRKVNTLNCSGGTNLSGAIWKSLELLHSSSTHVEPRNVRACLLFTDGCATQGICDRGEFIGWLSKAISTNSCADVAIHSFAIGEDADVQLLDHVASATRGVFTPVDLERLDQAFATVLAGLRSIVARNVELVIEAANGVEVIRIPESWLPEKITHSQYRIRCNLSAGESRSIVVPLRVGATHRPADSQELITVRARYFDAFRASTVSIACQLRVSRPQYEVCSSQRNHLVVLQREREVVVAALAAATSAGDAGNFEVAAEKVAEALGMLRGDNSSDARAQLVVALTTAASHIERLRIGTAPLSPGAMSPLRGFRSAHAQQRASPAVPLYMTTEQQRLVAQSPSAKNDFSLTPPVPRRPTKPLPFRATQQANRKKSTAFVLQTYFVLASLIIICTIIMYSVYKAYRKPGK